VKGVPREIEAALIAMGQPWELKPGGRHIKIMVCGQLAGVLPINGKCENDRRATLNIVSQIKRVARTGHAARRG
jgi:copper(I)-binding protein